MDQAPTVAFEQDAIGGEDTDESKYFIQRDAGQPLKILSRRIVAGNSRTAGGEGFINFGAKNFIVHIPTYEIALGSPAEGVPQNSANPGADLKPGNGCRRRLRCGALRPPAALNSQRRPDSSLPSDAFPKMLNDVANCTNGMAWEA